MNLFVLQSLTKSLRGVTVFPFYPKSQECRIVRNINKWQICFLNIWHIFYKHSFNLKSRLLISTYVVLLLYCRLSINFFVCQPLCQFIFSSLSLCGLFVCLSVSLFVNCFAPLAPLSWFKSWLGRTREVWMEDTTFHIHL